jgi:hypothetical protein
VRLQVTHTRSTKNLALLCNRALSFHNTHKETGLSGLSLSSVTDQAKMLFELSEQQHESPHYSRAGGHDLCYSKVQKAALRLRQRQNELRAGVVMPAMHVIEHQRREKEMQHRDCPQLPSAAAAESSLQGAAQSSLSSKRSRCRSSSSAARAPRTRIRRVKQRAIRHVLRSHLYTQVDAAFADRETHTPDTVAGTVSPAEPFDSPRSVVFSIADMADTASSAALSEGLPAVLCRTMTDMSSLSRTGTGQRDKLMLGRTASSCSSSSSRPHTSSEQRALTRTVPTALYMMSAKSPIAMNSCSIEHCIVVDCKTTLCLRADVGSAIEFTHCAHTALCNNNRLSH